MLNASLMNAKNSISHTLQAISTMYIPRTHFSIDLLSKVLPTQTNWSNICQIIRHGPRLTTLYLVWAFFTTNRDPLNLLKDHRG